MSATWTMEQLKGEGPDSGSGEFRVNLTADDEMLTVRITRQTSAEPLSKSFVEPLKNLPNLDAAKRCVSRCMSQMLRAGAAR
jgi:hypothetical protein